MRRNSTKLTRRGALTIIAVTAGGGTFLAADLFGRRQAMAQGNLIEGAGVCTIMPETTEGPFYFDPALERGDITEGKPGIPLRLRLQVVDEMCVPIAGARVDIWHCDADGAYSGYPRQPGGIDTRDMTFLRGTQIADESGVASFSTIYPGWYPGRTPHIHFKAFPDERRVLTGLLFFPDEVSREVYTTIEPYSARGVEGATFNDRDGIARRAGPAALSAVVRESGGLDAAIVIGIATG